MVSTVELLIPNSCDMDVPGSLVCCLATQPSLAGPAHPGCPQGTRVAPWHGILERGLNVALYPHGCFALLVQQGELQPGFCSVSLGFLSQGPAVAGGPGEGVPSRRGSGNASWQQNGSQRGAGSDLPGRKRVCGEQKPAVYGNLRQAELPGV